MPPPTIKQSEGADNTSEGTPSAWWDAARFFYVFSSRSIQQDILIQTTSQKS